MTSNEKFFRDFWLGVNEAAEKERLEQKLLALKDAEKRKKLEQELLTLKKRELYRQYVSLATMAPFALLMAIELGKTCSDQVLLGVISCALSHTMLPFAALSLICTLYLIYNNRKIAEKERELEDIENGKMVGAEKEKKDIPYTIDDYVNYADAALVTLVIVANIISEALEQEIIEDVAFSISSLFYFVVSANFFYREYKKSEEHEAGKEQESSNEKPKKETNNMSAATVMFAGSSVLLIRRIMLISEIALASFLHPAVGPALGLVGIALLMAGSGLITHSYKRELENVKVSGKSRTGAGVVGNIVDGGPNQEPSCTL
ncbi:MAG: hypothetical protein ACR5K9_03055 [Wolbachia sp.]